VRRRIISSLVAACWAFLTVVGLELVSNVARRGIAGYPNAGQWRFYVTFPLVMLLFSAGLVLLSKRLTTVLYAALVIVGILAIAPFLLFYGGGL